MKDTTKIALGLGIGALGIVGSGLAVKLGFAQQTKNITNSTCRAWFMV